MYRQGLQALLWYLLRAVTQLIPPFHPRHGHALPLSGDRQAQGAPVLSQPPPQVSDSQNPEVAPLLALRDQHNILQPSSADQSRLPAYGELPETATKGCSALKASTSLVYFWVYAETLSASKINPFIPAQEAGQKLKTQAGS